MDVIELDINNCNNSDNNYPKCIDALPIARAYIPSQRNTKTYPIIEGLKQGTVFPELNFPYKPIPKNYKSDVKFDC